MKLDILKGTTSRIIEVFVQDSSSSIGAGLTGVAFGDITAYYALNGAAGGATVHTPATMTIGTWASGGFIEKDATNMPGIYQLGVFNAALTGADSVIIMLKGATNMAPVVLEIQLTDYNPYDAVRLGLTALPNAVVDAAGGLATSAGGATGIDDLATSSALSTAQSDLDTITGAAGVIIDDSAANDTTISDAVWDEDATGHQTGGTFGQAIGDPGANTETMYDAVVTDAAGTNVAADIVAVKAETALIVADTNELQTDDVPGLIAALNDVAAGDVWAVDATTQQTQGTFGQAIGDPVADTTTIYQAVATDAAGDNVSIDVVAVKAETALIVADTNELQTDWADAGRLDAILDARASQTTADAIETDTQDIQSRLPAALVNSRMDATIDGTGMESGAVDAIWDEAMTETTGAPAVTGSFRDALKWMFALSRNKITQTSTTTTLRNDADAGDLATSTVSDDATTYTRGEWSV